MKPSMRILLSVALTGIVLVIQAAPARADVKLASIFGNGMVLQREMPVPIWGTASAGEKVTVVFQKQKKTATAGKDGKWLVKLDELKAGGPHELIVSGKNTLKLTDVLVGEVWVCSGQSNMAWPLGKSDNAEKEAAGANYAQLRWSAGPGNTPWEACSPNTAAAMAAVPYYFGRDLHKSLGVPVGLINRSVGGAPGRSFVAMSALEADPGMKPFLDKLKANPIVAIGGTYQSSIQPLMPFAIRGVIWYQGESDAGRADEYRALFQTLIRSWRADWGQGDFPFLFVQLAPINFAPKSPNADPGWFLVREAQAAALALPRTGMAVILDSDADLHPKQKQLPGQRLALAARGIAYGEKLVYSGPTFESLAADGPCLRVRFQHVGGGLVFSSDKPAGFAISGADGKYAWAEAKIDGPTVTLTAKEVPRPVAVRYGWGDNPQCNLFNKEGLPAASFRSELVKP